MRSAWPGLWPRWFHHHQVTRCSRSSHPCPACPPHPQSLPHCPPHLHHPPLPPRQMFATKTHFHIKGKKCMTVNGVWWFEGYELVTFYICIFSEVFTTEKHKQRCFYVIPMQSVITSCRQLGMGKKMIQLKIFFLFSFSFYISLLTLDQLINFVLILNIFLFYSRCKKCNRWAYSNKHLLPGGWRRFVEINHIITGIKDWNRKHNASWLTAEINAALPHCKTKSGGTL